LTLNDLVNNAPAKDLYKNLKLIGEGAAGEVYSAINKNNSKSLLRKCLLIAKILNYCARKLTL